MHEGGPQLGVSEKDAKILAGSLVRSDTRGVKSHGVVRIPDYAKALGAVAHTDGKNELHREVWDKSSPWEMTVDTPTATVIDGHGGIGFVLSHMACEITREKAKKNGIAFTTVRNSHHFGECALWSTQLCGKDRDMIGFATTSTVSILSVPNGVGPTVGSNPFSFAIPSGKYPPFCLDIACGIMAAGKIAEYRRLNRPLPEKAWIGMDGEYVTDPFQWPFTGYTMVPFGMHKGFGLSMVMEALSSFLSGGEFYRNDYREGETRPGNNHAFMAINPEMFGPPEVLGQKMEAYIDYVHAQKVRESCMRPVYPGEMEHRREADALAKGVKVSAGVFEGIAVLAEQKGIDVAPYRGYAVME